MALGAVAGVALVALQWRGRAQWRRHVLRELAEADAFCFDVDSTVVREEGIDALAAFCGAGAAVREFTKKAMEGNMPFEEALRARLEIIRPSRLQVTDCREKAPLTLTPGVRELFAALRARGKRVFLVSGGFRQLIEPVLASLGVDGADLVANELRFDAASGAFAGVDEQQFTARSGGKRAALQWLIARHKLRRVVMVGDGATDLEARPPAALFVGFGGVAVRPKVRDEADWFVYGFDELRVALEAAQPLPAGRV